VQPYNLSSCFLVPKDKVLHVAYCDDVGVVHYLSKTPWAAELPATLSAEGQLAALSVRGTRLATGCLRDGHFIVGPSYPLPRRYHGLCVLVINDFAYVGGSCGKDMIGRISLGGESAGQWEPLPKPAYMRQRGKAVDALLLREDMLYAVDNVIFPKYILAYKLTANYLKLVKVVSLDAHGTYEQVRASVLGSDYLAILSSTCSEMGHSCNLSFLDLDTLRERGAKGFHQSRRSSMWSSLRSSGEQPSDDEMPQFWYDIAATGDKVWIAAGMEGLLRISATDEAPPACVMTSELGPIVRVLITPFGGVLAVIKTEDKYVPVLMTETVC
jgi:hypothetical protein